jgi:hypothetical protein
MTLMELLQAKSPSCIHLLPYKAAKAVFGAAFCQGYFCPMNRSHDPGKLNYTTITIAALSC